MASNKKSCIQKKLRILYTDPDEHSGEIHTALAEGEQSVA